MARRSGPEMRPHGGAERHPQDPGRGGEGRRRAGPHEQEPIVERSSDCYRGRRLQRCLEDD
eukprot:1659988-Pyramimonas_sp.AAC.1